MSKKKNLENPKLWESYNDIVLSWGYEVIDSFDEDAYSGSSLYVLRDASIKPTIYGVLIFGWGSCSGCDAFEASCSKEELLELSSEMKKTIEWKSKDEVICYLQTHDFEGDFWDEQIITWVEKFLKKFKPIKED